jgi:DNA-binding SARP family transcriptional activator
LDGRAEQQQTRIRLCGRMVIEIWGRSIAPPGRQGRMLLAYQIANRSRPLQRDELEAVLWEGEPPADPDAVLSSVMSRLRRELGPEVLPPGDVSVQLPDDAWVDVEVIDERAQRMLQALKNGQPAVAAELAAEALALLDGKFLPDLEAKWIDDRRRELDELGLSLRRASVEARLQLGGEDLEQAERTARELVERAPYRESGHKLLMEVLVARGDLAEATLVYDRLRRLLLDELGKTPDPAITELNAQLLEGRTPDATSRPPAGGGSLVTDSPPEEVPMPALLDALGDGDFVGREEAIAHLCDCWAQASIKPRVAVLSGEPGIGKTRLAACFSHRVHRQGATVLYGCCHEERLTFQPFVEALGHYATVHDLARELPEVAEQLWRCLEPLHHLLRGAEPREHSPRPQDRYALFEAVVAVLRHAAERRPLLLVIDDLHWADAATFELMVHSVRSVTPSPCMFLVTSRHAADPRAGPPDGSAESLEARLGALRHEAQVEHVCLGGLNEEETAELIRARSDVARSDVFARGLWRRTSGNPLFIEEMLPLVGVEKEPDLSRVGVPVAVEEAIIRRLEHLGDKSRKLLASASVIGPEFPLWLVASVLRWSEEDSLDEIEELIRYGLVVEVPDRRDHFAFSHALVRETQYGCLIVSRRARIHKRVALELEQRAKLSADGEGRVAPAELAYHFYEARPAVDAQVAAEYAIKAAKHAEHSAAYEEADAQYHRAVELLRSVATDESMICGLLIARGKSQLRAGQLDDARRTFRDAAAIARRNGETEKLAHAALGFHGRYSPAGEVHRERIELLEEALEALDPANSALRARLLARLADSLLWAEGDREVRLSADAVRMARRLRNPTAMLEALAAQHAALLHTEHLGERSEVGHERLELARKTGSHEAIAAALRFCIHDLCERGELRAAKQQYVELNELADGLRQPLYRSYALHWECVFAQLHGRLEEAERLADEVFDLAKREGVSDAEMSHVDKRSAIYREQGLLPTLRPAIERFAREKTNIPAWSALLALVEAGSGNMANARAQVDRLVADDAAALRRDAFWLYAMALLAETCALLEDSSKPASVVYRLLLPYADRHVQAGMDMFWGSASRFLGLAATQCGEWESADRHFRYAEERHEEIGSAPLLARTLVDHAGMLLQRGGETHRAEAARVLVRAEHATEGLKLVAIGRRAEQLQAKLARTAALV